MTLVAVCHFDDDPELGEGKEEESAVADASKEAIPRTQSRRFGMTSCVVENAGPSRR